MKKQLLALSALSLLATASIPSAQAEEDYVYQLSYAGHIYDSFTNERYNIPRVSKVDGLGSSIDSWGYRMFDYVKRQCVEHLPGVSDEENDGLSRVFSDLRSHNIQFDERNCPIPDNVYLVNDNNESNIYANGIEHFLLRDIDKIKWKYMPCEGADLAVFMNTVNELTDYKRNRFPADLTAYSILKSRVKATGDDPKQHTIKFLKAWDKTKSKVSKLNDILNDWRKEVLANAAKVEKARVRNDRVALNAAKEERAELGNQWLQVRDQLGYKLTESPFGLEDACRFDLEEGDDELLQDEPPQ